MMHLADGCGEISPERRLRRRDGRRFGFGGSLGQLRWQLWDMLLSRILRELALAEYSKALRLISLNYLGYLGEMGNGESGIVWDLQDRELNGANNEMIGYKPGP